MLVLVRIWFTVFLLSSVFGLGQAHSQSVQQGITPKGWRYEQAAGQIERYFCLQATCGQRAVVSYQSQPVKSGYTLAAFRQEKNENYAALGQNLLSGGPLKIGVPSLRKAGPTPLMTIEAAGTLRNGEPHIRVSGYLLGRNQTVSLISSATDRAAARKNFDIFAAILARQEADGTLK